MSDDHQPELPPLTDAEHALADMVRVMEQAYWHLYSRDRSNAALHMAETVERPLTKAVDDLLHGPVQVVWAELRQARKAAAPVPDGKLAVTVHLDADAVARLAQLDERAGGSGDAAAAAEAALENYAKTLSARYCFEHRTDGCGNERGQHQDAPASA